MSNTSLRMAYGNRYKNADVHDCTWYRQNAQRRDREIPHRDTREDKFLHASLSLAAKCFTQRSDCQVACHTPIGQACNDAAIIQVNDRTVISNIASTEK